MRYKTWIFVFTALSGLGGVACTLQWLEIKPKDVWGWHVSLTLPHWLWLLGAIILFLAATASSGYSLYKSIGIQKVATSAKTRSRLDISSAVYSAIEGGGTAYDVTEFMRQIVTGDSLVLDIENHNFVNGDRNFVPTDPKPFKPKQLRLTYSFDNGQAVTIERPEHSRLVLPEDSELGRRRLELEKANHLHASENAERTKYQNECAILMNRVRELEQQQKKSDKLSLRDCAFVMCEKLESFVKRHGERPNPYLIPSNNSEEYTRIYNETVQVWDNKFQADYWKNHKDKVVDLRHELAMKSLTSEALDNRLNEAETAALTNVTVSEIAKNLRLLAAQL